MNAFTAIIKKQMAKKITIIIEKADGNYSAYCPEVPGCIATGATEEETYQTMMDALKFHMEGMELENIPIELPQIFVRQAELR